MIAELLSISTLVAALVIFLLRIFDVSLGTLRTIALVQGRIVVAMALGFFEVLIWIFVISEVMSSVQRSPLLLVAYAAGFAAGNGVGIILDRYIAMGIQVVRIITHSAGAHITEKIRELGQAVTTFKGEGRDGPVTLIYLTCPRKRLPGFLQLALELDPQLFYVIEPVSGINRRVFGVPTPTGWRSIGKKK